MDDTSAVASRLQLACFRRMGPAGRLRAAFETSELARHLSLARLRAEHPDWPTRDIVREYARVIAADSPVASGQ